ncbi:HD family phosphohydrolase [Candidatus Ruminimicrobiellum ovillum]|uniref:HD family phosphohydrolase n=1 Tax=Candidatus Ruminimicrobiellum ovillum TaxID=1947927 RepID=UPI003559CEE4
MKTLRSWLKSKVKKFLLFLIKQLDNEVPIVPKIRLSSDNILKKDISVPIPLTVIVSFICIYFMLIMQTTVNYLEMVGVFVALLSIFAFEIFYFKYEANKINLDNVKVLIISFITVVSLLSFQIYTSLMSQISFPLSAFTVLMALLVSVRVSVVYTFTMVIFFILINDFSIIVPLFHIAGGLVSVINVRKIRSRTGFTRVGINIFFAMLVPLIVFYFFNILSLDETIENIAYVAMNAALSVLMILALLPIFESLFSRTTNIKLIELSDFNSPLLKRLMEEAPGTYHHSLMTASIAGNAAEAIGENALLARVCAYYHDIGKLKNPEYFIENQNGAKNPHDEISPSMSGLVLVSHVKDGVALAKQYKIDKIIVDAINQHHGTSLIQYFYYKALEKDSSVNEQDFRYPGQKPTTKIAAILMISDSVEAISRTLKETSAGKLKEMVEKVINNKFADGQFSDCPITLKDLFEISESVTNTLCSIYHARIEYKSR